MIKFKAEWDGKFLVLADRIELAAKAGMLEAMRKLAVAVVAEMGAEGIQNRTGQTAAKILQSPRVRSQDNGELIIGSIPSPEVGGKHIGIWLQEGISVPEVIAKKVMAFAAPDGTMVFTRRHKAFTIPGRPFENRALHSNEAMITETIRQSVNQAINA